MTCAAARCKLFLQRKICSLFALAAVGIPGLGIPTGMAQNASPLQAAETTALPLAPTAHQLRFVQITDAHLFDAGSKCSGKYVELERRENLGALEWALSQVAQRIKGGETVDFVVFTGDLGLENLKDGNYDPTSPEKTADTDGPCVEKGGKFGPVAPVDYEKASAQLANSLRCLPKGLPVYFVPGNNDLENEDPATIDHYQRFIAALQSQKPIGAQVYDLDQTAATVKGYRLLGFNTASFKADAAERSATGKRADGACDDVGVDSSTSTTGIARTDEKTMQIEALERQLASGGDTPTLVFTHVPNLQDPYEPARKNADSGCYYRSVWVLSKYARAQWQKIAASPKLVGIFAGHFHSWEPSNYGGPQPGAGGDSTVGRFFVAPPLAIKVQWTKFPPGMRGLMLVSIDGLSARSEVVRYFSTIAGECCSDSKESLFARVSAIFAARPSLAFWAAAVVVALLMVLLIVLIGQLPEVGFVDMHKPPLATSRLELALTRAATPFLNLLIDGETKTYSLSKLQFLLWTLVSIYSYTYLVIANVIVQRLPGLPDFTTRFPTEILLSAGTVVATQVSSSVLGSKGGGPVGPRLSDLISAGGTVASARIQFLLWTLVSVSAYLLSVLATDPCHISVLPAVPTRLLEVSGISIAAYLGTRAASPAGPVLTQARLLAETLELTGEYLSPYAVLTLSGDDAPKLIYETPFGTDPKDQQPGTPTLYRRLTIKISGQPASTDRLLRLQNPDGKYAEVAITLA